VDIGVHQDGLVHISALADRYVKNPADVVKVHQKVMVTVMEVDLKRKRIALSMKSKPESEQQTVVKTELKVRAERVDPVTKEREQSAQVLSLKSVRLEIFARSYLKRIKPGSSMTLGTL